MIYNYYKDPFNNLFRVLGWRD